MATTYAHSSVTTQVNNGGTIVKAGNVDSSGPITNSVDIMELAKPVDPKTGSKVVANDGTGAATTDRVGISGINPSVALAYNASSTEWLIRGVATTIGGVANTVLLNKGADYDGKLMTRDHIHQTVKTTALGSGNGTFDFYAIPSTDITPNYTKGAGAGDTINFVRASGNGLIPATDDAATPTRSVPGELTYRFGAPNPTSTTYKARNVFES